MKDVIARTIRSVSSKPKDEKVTRRGFIEEIEAIRERARRPIEEGAVTNNYKGDRNAVISLLNIELLSTSTNTSMLCLPISRRG